MKKSNSSFLWIRLAISFILLVVAVYCIELSFSGIASSITSSRLSSEIRANPQLWSGEIQTLKEHKLDLERRLRSAGNLIAPDLQAFSKVAENFGLRLVGVNVKGASVGEKSSGQGYTLIFQGGLVSLLDALDFIENNILLKIDNVTIGLSQTKNRDLEMSLRFTFPEKSIENEKN